MRFEVKTEWVCGAEQAGPCSYDPPSESCECGAKCPAIRKHQYVELPEHTHSPEIGDPVSGAEWEPIFPTPPIWDEVKVAVEERWAKLKDGTVWKGVKLGGVWGAWIQTGHKEMPFVELPNLTGPKEKL